LSPTIELPYTLEVSSRAKQQFSILVYWLLHKRAQHEGLAPERTCWCTDVLVQL